MTFPSSGPGYPQQGGPPQQPPGQGGGAYPPAGQPAHGGAVSTLNIAVFLGLAVTVLGLAQYFMGFSDEAAAAGQATIFLLVGGLLAAMRLLPAGPKVLPFAVLFSVLGGLEGIDALIGIDESAETPGILIVVVIFGILQLLVAVAALLFDQGLLKLPPPKPQAPYGQPYAQQPPQPQGQQPAQGPPSGGFNQPTQYGPPVTPPSTSPAQQPTQYASQQGQFFHQQQAEQQGKKPETPPGGFNPSS